MTPGDITDDTRIRASVPAIRLGARRRRAPSW
jgi:3-phosphoglycerate kinase